MKEIIKIRPEEFRTSVWSGGITEEIYIFPPEAVYRDRNFIYRISTAVVDSEQSVFTPLPDYTRYITPLDGILSLFIGPEKFRLEPFQVLEFDGGDQVSSQSRGGLRDLNLMVRKGHEGSLKVGQGMPELELAAFQVILRLAVNDAGNYSQISEVWIKPNGAAPEISDWTSSISDASSWVAVFTLPEARGLV